MPLLTKAKQRTVISALRDSNVRDIEQNYNEPAKLWCNEKWITAACLRCSDQRCIRYIDAEISCGSFSDFPYERNLNVCPVDAIKWNFEKELPEIENMGFMFWIILKIFHWIRIQNCQSIMRKLQKRFTVQVRDIQQVHIQIDITFRKLSRSL